MNKELEKVPGMGDKQQVGVVEHREKIPVGLFLAKPLKKLGRVITNWCRRIFGYWYCGHCKRYHSARVVRYDVTGGLGDDVCSLGKENRTLFGSLCHTLQNVGDALRNNREAIVVYKKEVDEDE